ncbi:MAG: SRPBCC family protein [Candidatus Marinimicrobia bacterium]|nr:SRPBCC family protein [Candidatus Neomarinimicrobiota bacterium]
MAFYQFKRAQLVPASLDEVWDFISSPANLQKITPPSMGFEITSDELPEKMYQGMIIRYRVSPILGIPTTWVTEITQIQQGKFFIDEQRVGPYSMWHHEHHLEAQAGGIFMRDIISYQPPFGILGAMANKFFIQAQLKRIFDYRNQALIEIFGPNSPQ